MAPGFWSLRCPFCQKAMTPLVRVAGDAGGPEFPTPFNDKPLVCPNCRKKSHVYDVTVSWTLVR